MPLTLSWEQIAVRLLCALAAGFAVGFNRDERGHSAGMRTNVLVCLAACVAMLQANLMMSTTGKAPDSFVVLDLMRMPLGILSGIGFIGAGAILRRGEMVQGVTTAATLWIVTVLGLCFGGGQLGLGAAGTALTLVALSAFKSIEHRMPHMRSGVLTVRLDGGTFSEERLRSEILASGAHIRSWGIRGRGIASRNAEGADSAGRTITAELRWRARGEAVLEPPIVRSLLAEPGVLSLEWK